MTIEFVYVTTLEQYDEALEGLRSSKSLAADTETYCLPEWEGKGGSALDPHTGRISLVILKGRKTCPYVFDILWLQHHNADFDKLRDLLFSRSYLLLQNAKFDLKFFYCTFGWMPENIRDTLIYSKMLGNATGSKAAQSVGHGYADLCREILNVHISGKKQEQTSTWYLPLSHRNRENEWWLSKLTYAANDVQYLFKLEKILRPAIINPMPHTDITQSGNHTGEWGLGMEKVLQIELEYVVVAAEIEYRGIGVSKPTLQAYQAAVSRRVNELATELCVDLEIEAPGIGWDGELCATATTLKSLRSSAGLLKAIHKALKLQKIDNTQKATLTRLLDIIDKLFEDTGGEDADGEFVNKEKLEAILINEDEGVLFEELTLFEMGQLQEMCPIVKKIVDFKMYVKQESANLMKYINPVTGRIHYNLTTIGAATSRSSASSPNLQQVTGRVGVMVEMPVSEAWKPTCMEICI